MKRFLGTPLIDYLPAIALFAVAVIYLVTGYGYTPQARQFPIIVAWAAIVLVALDFISRTRTPVGEALMRWFNPSASPGKAEARAHYPASKQIAAVLWTAGFVTLIVLIGFLYAVPIYVFASMYVRGRRPLLLCLVVSATATLFIYLIFEQLLELELYPGILFGGF